MKGNLQWFRVICPSISLQSYCYPHVLHCITLPQCIKMLKSSNWKLLILILKINKKNLLRTNWVGLLAVKHILCFLLCLLFREECFFSHSILSVVYFWASTVCGHLHTLSFSLPCGTVLGLIVVFCPACKNAFLHLPTQKAVFFFNVPSHFLDAVNLGWECCHGASLFLFLRN